MAVSNICCAPECNERKHLKCSYCQDHQRERSARYRSENKGLISDSSALYYKENRERIKAYNLRHYTQNRREINVRKRARHARIRADVVSHYGSKCECCGENTYEFLAIDHVAGDRPPGAPSRSLDLLRWLRRHNYPAGFRLLCHNCNMSYGMYGICPHVFSS